MRMDPRRKLDERFHEEEQRNDSSYRRKRSFLRRKGNSSGWKEKKRRNDENFEEVNSIKINNVGSGSVYELKDDSDKSNIHSYLFGETHNNRNLLDPYGFGTRTISKNKERSNNDNFHPNGEKPVTSSSSSNFGDDFSMLGESICVHPLALAPSSIAMSECSVGGARSGSNSGYGTAGTYSDSSSSSEGTGSKSCSSSGSSNSDNYSSAGSTKSQSSSSAESTNSYDSNSIVDKKYSGDCMENTAIEVIDRTGKKTGAPMGKLLCWRGKKCEIQDNNYQYQVGSYHYTDDQSKRTKQQGSLSDSDASKNLKEMDDKSLGNSSKYHDIYSFFSFGEDKSIPLKVQYEQYGEINSTSIRIEKENQFFFNTEEGEVILQVEASTISHTDCQIRMGELREGSLQLPITPGVDVVGKIYQISKSTSVNSGFKNGDRVMSLIKIGGNARFVKICTDQLVKVPCNLKAEEVVCLAETYLSAFQALHFHEHEDLRYENASLSGKSILLVGSPTVLGRAVLELAGIAGATLVYAICKTKNRDQIQKLGATPLGENIDEWMPFLKGRIDLIIDAGLGTIIGVQHCLNVLQKNGYSILINRSEERKKGFKYLSCVTLKAKTRVANKIIYYNVFEEWDQNLKLCKRDLRYLVKLLGAKRISPRILDRVALQKVGKAQEMMNEKRLRGFLVCEPSLNTKESPLLCF